MLGRQIMMAAGLAMITSCVAADQRYLPHTSPAAVRQLSAMRMVMPIFSQILLAPRPSGFNMVYENTQGRQYISEMVPAGENAKRWTKMFTISGARDLAANPNLTPQIFANGMAAGFKHMCPYSFSALGVSANRIDGYEAFTLILSCGVSQAAPAPRSEAALISVIKGERDYFTLQWAERGAPSSRPVPIDFGKWSEKYQKLAMVRLCCRIPGEAAPYPSCISRP